MSSSYCSIQLLPQPRNSGQISRLKTITICQWEVLHCFSLIFKQLKLHCYYTFSVIHDCFLQDGFTSLLHIQVLLLPEIIIAVRTRHETSLLDYYTNEKEYKKNSRLMKWTLKWKGCFLFCNFYNLFFFPDKILKLKTPIHQSTCYLENSGKNNFQMLATLIQNNKIWFFHKILFFQRLVVPFTDLVVLMFLFNSLSPFIMLQPDFKNDRR